MTEKILIASDHAGLPLKKHLIAELSREGVEFIDLGPEDEKSVDYPDFAKKLCEALLSKKATRGILMCGSGQGMAITANRFKGIRAALCWDLPSSELARKHNDANVLCLGARLIPFGYAAEIAKKFLSTPFEGGRHQNRVRSIDVP